MDRQSQTRKPYPMGASDDEWALVVPTLSLKTWDAPGTGAL